MKEAKNISCREQYSLRLTYQEKEELKNLARKNNSSLNNYIYRILKNEINQYQK